MKGLSSILILFAWLNCFGQNSPKYAVAAVKEKLFQYSDSKTYARTIQSIDDLIYIGNSDGSIYRIHKDSSTSHLLFKRDSINKIGDVEIVNTNLFALSSSENSVLLQIDLADENKLTRHTKWDGTFLNGFDILDQTGFIMGDPIDGKFVLYFSNDEGRNWIKCSGKVKAKEGEVGFASSGTNVQVLDENTFVFITGGLVSRFFKTTNRGDKWKEVLLPFKSNETSGANSICFSDLKHGVIVGGDYKSSMFSRDNTFYTEDGGETWQKSESSFSGFMACVYFVNDVYYACGMEGIYYSEDNGKHWYHKTEGNFFSLTSIGKQLVATKTNGTIQYFDLVK